MGSDNIEARAVAPDDGRLHIVTFNLRCVWEGDGINGFVARGPGVVEKIRAARPQVIGCQEGIERSVAFLRENLPEYEIIFNQRNADLRGEGMALLYRRGEITLLSSDFFFLSETPDVPGTSYRGAGCPRLCQYALLRRESDGLLFRVFNTHLDFANADVRLASMKQILAVAAAERARFAVTPVFITGDMNAPPDEESMLLPLSFAEMPMADLTAGVGDTFHAYGDVSQLCKIDYIFADAASAARGFASVRWTEEKDGVYLSDHYPVETAVEI